VKHSRVLTNAAAGSKCEDKLNDNGCRASSHHRGILDIGGVHDACSADALRGLLQHNSVLRTLDLTGVNVGSSPEQDASELVAVAEALSHNRTLRFLALAGFKCVPVHPSAS
jgi:hypothetical protein